MIEKNGNRPQPAANQALPARPSWARPVALGAAIFGLATLVAGGSALFGSSEAKNIAGQVVPFVLWFNFLAGFVYLAAAHAIFWWRPWAFPAAAMVAVGTILVGIALAIHIAGGGAFEVRTLGAMALRGGVWSVIALLLWRGQRQGQGDA